MKRLFEVWLDFAQKVIFYLRAEVGFRIFLSGGPISL